jgi:integrase
MQGPSVKINLPGLICEPMPSGARRWRVRVEGKPHLRIALTVTPDHPEFMEIYRAARAGVALAPQAPAIDRTIRHSVAWLTHAYLDHLAAMVKAGQASPATLKQRRHFMTRLRDHVVLTGRAKGSTLGEMHMDMPQAELVAFRDCHAATSGSADKMTSAIRAMYRWAAERGLTKVNPAVGIGNIHRGQGGATPWTAADLRQFAAHHPSGTMPRLALLLFIFTAARVSDAVVLGRRHETTQGGITWLSWDAAKKDALPVSIPLLPALAAEIRAQKVAGATYLLSQHGKPYASTDSFRNRFKAWCIAAGLPDRSPHGIRKAAGHLLAEFGATQHQIMVIHGHARAETSEIYTRGVARIQLARDAMAKLAMFKL